LFNLIHTPFDKFFLLRNLRVLDLAHKVSHAEPLKQKGKLENFRVSTSTSGGNLFVELFLKFPKIDDATLMELRILRK
jgi:hypothetical protein